MIRLTFLFAFLFAFLLTAANSSSAATPSYTVKGKIAGAGGYTVFMLFNDGSSKSVTLPNSGRFSFKKLSTSKLKGASLQLADTEGRYLGPIVLAKKGSKVSTTFKGKGKKEIDLGTISLFSSFAKVRTKLSSDIFAKPNVPADASGKPVGAGESGLVARTSPSIGPARANAESEANPGADADTDGLPDSFDADDDGDLVLDASDADSVGQDVPYTALFLDFRRTLNANVRDGLNDTVIDAAVSGENTFALTFFVSLPQDSPINSGHVVCDDSLVYCRPNTPTAFYGGVSESSDEFRNHAWSELLTSAGYPRMEQLNLSGGTAIAASIQPRVGRSQFRAGDIYRLVLKRDTTEISSRTFTLAPYFVSIPALKSYDAGFGIVDVDYSAVTPDSGSIPGTSPGDPIVLSGAGELAVTFWRPQRQAIRSDESGFYDWGRLHYGIVIDEAQATCAGYYMNVSSDLLADDTPLGEGDSPFANAGANMYPYTDLQGDRAANAAQTLAYTVNLKDCRTRAGISAGIRSVTLSASGESVTGGQSAAAQTLYVQIP